MERVRLPLADLDAEGRALIEFDGLSIVVFRVDDRFYAFDNACPHEGNPLLDGDVLGPNLTCAYHGWTFDLETGSCLAGDAAATRFPVELKDADLWIELEEP